MHATLILLLAFVILVAVLWIGIQAVRASAAWVAKDRPTRVDPFEGPRDPLTRKRGAWDE